MKKTHNRRTDRRQSYNFEYLLPSFAQYRATARLWLIFTPFPVSNSGRLPNNVAEKKLIALLAFIFTI